MQCSTSALPGKRLTSLLISNASAGNMTLHSLRWFIKNMRQTSSTFLCLSAYGLLLLLILHHIEWLTDYIRRMTFRKAAQIISYLQTLYPSFTES
jgi:hypothetical protein